MKLPEGGWKGSTYYRVQVSLREGNPAHESIFYSGFLDKNGNPCGYSCFLNPTYEGTVAYESRRAKMYVIEELFTRNPFFWSEETSPSTNEKEQQHD